MQKLSQTNQFKYWQDKIAKAQSEDNRIAQDEDKCDECGGTLTSPVFRNSIPGDYVTEQECTECGAFYSY